MSSNVGDKLISAVGGLDKVETMTTNCNIGSCSLSIRFTSDTTDIEYTNLMNKLRSSIEAIDDFPSSMVDKPVVTDDISAGGGSSSNVITFVGDGSMSQQDMYDYVAQQLVPQFKHIPGVGAVWGPYGGSHRAVRVWLNPDPMKELNIGTQEVVDTLTAYNTGFTSGAIIGKSRNFSLNPVTQVQTIDDVKRLVIRQDKDRIIRISDVADVVYGETSLNPSALKVNGKAGCHCK